MNLPHPRKIQVIGIAETGSGKTLSFLLPLFRHILDQPAIAIGVDGPIGLIIGPTRELCAERAVYRTESREGRYSTEFRKSVYDVLYVQPSDQVGMIC